MRVLAPAMLLVFLGGCPWCPTGEMTEVGGDHDGEVRAGEVVSLRASYGDWTVGPGECGGLWLVDGALGGSLELGTVDPCGRYQAPSMFAAGVARVTIVASKYGEGCADCCPASSTTLTVVR